MWISCFLNTNLNTHYAESPTEKAVFSSPTRRASIFRPEVIDLTHNWIDPRRIWPAIIGPFAAGNRTKMELRHKSHNYHSLAAAHFTREADVILGFFHLNAPFCRLKLRRVIVEKGFLEWTSQKMNDKRAGCGNRGPSRYIPWYGHLFSRCRNYWRKIHIISTIVNLSEWSYQVKHCPPPLDNVRGCCRSRSCRG